MSFDELYLVIVLDKKCWKTFMAALLMTKSRIPIVQVCRSVRSTRAQRRWIRVNKIQSLDLDESVALNNEISNLPEQEQ